MHIAYKTKNFGEMSLAIIAAANEIIEEYQQQGFSLTLRQLYYQFVARDLLPNRQSEYKRLGKIVNDARMSGLIDWEAIEDRTRNVQSLSHWDSPAEILGAVAKQYHTDLWESQEYRVEVWIEKEALISVVERVCQRYDVPYFACRGYTSQSEQWRAGQRFAEHNQAGQRPVVIHLGDHDPSGIDMTRDNAERLGLFVRSECYGGEVEVVRAALNADQVEKYNPPPNPAKMADSRFSSYVRRFGHASWELDALDPRTIEGVILRHIMNYLDEDAFAAARAAMLEERELLEKLSDNWDDVRDKLTGL